MKFTYKFIPISSSSPRCNTKLIKIVTIEVYENRVGKSHRKTFINILLMTLQVHEINDEEITPKERVATRLEEAELEKAGLVETRDQVKQEAENMEDGDDK